MSTVGNTPSNTTTSDRRQATVVFADISGFTELSGKLDPEDLTDTINDCFKVIERIVLEHGGTVDKYLGDGLMAVFETDTPEQSATAALAAVEGISKALAEFNTPLTEEGSATIAIGIGVHLGNVVLGEIGAAGLAPRTLIGDTVNTASRLEGQTKTLGVQALVSLDVLMAAGLETDGADLLSLDLRGRETSLVALPVRDATMLRAHLSTVSQPLSAQ